MSGKELFDTLVMSTGLPEEYVRERFQKLMAQHGRTLENLSLDDVREMLSDLLLSLINEANPGSSELS